MVESAGRANAKVTAATVIFRGISRTLIVLCAGVSLHAICVAEDQAFALGNQVAQLMGAAVGGSLSVLSGNVCTPLAAVFEGLAVGMIGGVAGEQLYAVVADVFLGGRQSVNTAARD